MKRITKFDKPTQVMFYDIEKGCHTGGIGYGKEVICGCCGAIFEIDELYETELPNKEPIIPMEWIDIEAEIRGD